MHATLDDLLGDASYLGSCPGLIAALHTWSQALVWQPQLPGLVTGGDLTGEGQWRAVRSGLVGLSAAWPHVCGCWETRNAPSRWDGGPWTRPRTTLPCRWSPTIHWARVPTAVAQSAAMNTMYGHAMRCARLSAGYLLAGRLAEAYTQAERAFDFARTHQERSAQAWILPLLGDLALHDMPTNPEPAATHYQQARALAEALGMRPLQAHCYLGIGMLDGRTGRGPQARMALTTAAELYQAMGMSSWRSQAEVELAHAGTSTERTA